MHKHIKEIAVASEMQVVQTKLADSETLKLKDGYIARSIQLGHLRDELDGVKADYKMRMKPIEEELSTALSSLRKGYKEEEKEVFLVPDHEKSVMEYYTEDGVLVMSRPLRPDEKQLNNLRLMAGNGDTTK